ncbi:MAG: FtsX-like permease family protein [candidate division Zixibacteria bacterium]|nr:FtsX-like permease family protein [candidate division Zixibacteria bacterium]
MKMLKNYIKTALRYLLKQKAYSLINVIGLSVGMACAILILMWIQYELSYDSFNRNIDNLYRFYQKYEYTGSPPLFTDNLPGPLGKTVQDEFPEIENTSRLLYGGTVPIRYGDKCEDEMGFCFSDHSIFKMFTFPLVSGDIESALRDPYTVVISEEIATKYFGDVDPVGKTVNIDNSYDFIVTGVMKDIPPNSHMWYVDILVPFVHTKEFLGTTFESWGQNWPTTYIQLRNGTNPIEFGQKISNVLAEHQESPTTLFIQSLKDINIRSISGEGGFITYIYIFTAVAFIILLLACINYMNLSIARAVNRVKEIGVRKVTGACRSNIFIQFLIESILISCFAIVFALVLIEVLVPIFNELSDAHIKLDLFDNYRLLSMIISVVLFTGIFSGSYPAYLLSSFQPVKAIKGVFVSRSKRLLFRRIMVIFQFLVSTFLIISAIIIHNQIDYMNSKDIGYDKSNLAYTYLRGDSGRKYDALKQELLNHPEIVSVTTSTKLPISGGNSTSNYDWTGKDPELTVLINRIDVDYNYFDAMGMEIASGRSFVKEDIIKDGESKNYILNEAAIRRMGMESPVGKHFGQPGDMGYIIGVVGDFHFESLSREIEPLLICVNPLHAQVAFVRFGSENYGEALRVFEEAWYKVNPNIPFSQNFLDERLERLYGFEQRLGKIFQYSSALAIFIASLGLLGLVSFTAQQRTKELGIRRVLGASVTGLVYLLIKEFTKLVVIANIIAFPLAYYILNGWLKDFAYRIEIEVWVFLSAAVITLIISTLMVLFQTYRAACTNPVNVLRYE